MKVSRARWHMWVFLETEIAILYSSCYTKNVLRPLLFHWQVNLEYLEGKLESLDGEELMKIKDNINCLFQHCIQALGEEHPIRVVNALQVQGWETGEVLFNRRNEL
jgi:hypothetical protein